MKNIKPLALMAFAVIISFSTANAQQKVGFFREPNFKAESNFGFYGFTGQDASDFSTSIKGFGSGILDNFIGRSSMDFISFGIKKANISLGLGLAFSKFRFADNLVLALDGGQVTWQIDPDPSHDYINTFFGYGKTKLVNASVYVPLDLNLTLGENFLFSVGGFADFSYYTKFKSKYKLGDDRIKELIRPSDMKNFNLNRIKYGVSAMLYHKELGVGISGSYYLTPFFKTDLGPDLQEFHMSLFSKMGNIKEEIAKKR